MSVATVRLQAEVEQHLEAMESAAQGEVVDASEVHEWLSSWGTGGERDAPDPDSIRDIVFGRYVVRYSVHASAIIVLRVWHGPPHGTAIA